MGVRFSKAAGVALCLSLLAGGCTTSRSGGGAVAADDAAGRCVASAVGGAILGTLIGAAAGGSRGAAIGAAAGGVTGGLGCAVLTALDAQDKERIRNAEIAAAATNRPRYLSYVGTDGRQREITVRPQPAPVRTAETGERICRATDTTATIAGAGSADLPQKLVCRTPSGAWVQV